MVIVSSGYIGKSLFTLNDRSCDFTYITYPFTLPGKVKDDTQIRLKQTPSVVQEQTHAIIRLLGRALMDMRSSYYRGYFLDVIGMMEDQELANMSA